MAHSRTQLLGGVSRQSHKCEFVVNGSHLGTQGLIFQQHEPFKVIARPPRLPLANDQPTCNYQCREERNNEFDYGEKI